MREDTLLGLRNKGVGRPTPAQPGWAVYPHLIPELTRRAPNQLWVAEITDGRLPCEFISVAVRLDAYRRRCSGWALDDSREAQLALDALRMALAARAVRPGLVHHSDRGVQYASHTSTNLLTDDGIRISMSRTGTPYDKAQAESFIKTLKDEEVYRLEYQTLAEARRRIGQFIAEVYNETRLHSALGSRPPAECERLLVQ